MAYIDCSEATFNCSSTNPDCRNPAGFHFPSLWNITQRYSEQCPNGPWLVASAVIGASFFQNIALTDHACKLIAGSGWTKYPGADIWQRLTTWKFPLFQLVANSPRPPLGWWIESFAFVHFLGDPVGTISDLLRKLDGCQTRATFWQDRLADELRVLHDERGENDQRRLWKALAIIADSFDEWGLDIGNQAQQSLLAHLELLCSSDKYDVARQQYVAMLFETAEALAADRSTKFLPVIIAQGFFIASIAIAMIRTQSTGEGAKPTSYINVEMYSIAFTAQYFWVIFAVVWTSIIGVSQTAAAIPRTLNRLQANISLNFPLAEMSELPTSEFNNERRIYNGGVYSWQPARGLMSSQHNSELEHLVEKDKSYKPTLRQRVALAVVLRPWSVFLFILPYFVLTLAAGTGLLISALVPPEGWSCRSTSMLYMYGTWLANHITSVVINAFGRRYQEKDGLRSRRILQWEFWITFIKDLVAIGITFGIIVYTQFGIFNRCDCYTKSGQIGLQLPFMPSVRTILEKRLTTAYPAVVAVGIALQLVILPALLMWRYLAAVRVYLQRDDGGRNLYWWSECARSTINVFGTIRSSVFTAFAAPIRGIALMIRRLGLVRQ